MKKNRINITQDKIDAALKTIGDKTQYRLNQKGFGTFSSTHEILGILEEEFDELKDAIRSNIIKDISVELIDIAVACHFALACIDSESLDLL